MVARGLHQRLRHREHGRGALDDKSAARTSEALPGGAEVLPQPRAGLREPVRPARRVLPGQVRRAATGRRRRTSSTRGSGARAATTPRPTAGTSRSTRRRTAQGLANLYGGRDELAAKLDEFFATPETAKFPGTYGGTIHEMLEARDVRMGQWGASNQVSHHIPYMYDYAGSRARRRRSSARRSRGCSSGSDDRPGLPRRRGQRRAVGLVPVQRARLLPAADGQRRRTRSARRCSRRRRCTCRTAATSSINAPQQQPEERLRAGHAAQRDGLRQDVPDPRPSSPTAARIDFAMGPKPSTWGDRPNAAPPSITQRRRGPAAARRRGARPTRARRPRARAPTSALFDDTSARRRR